MMDDDPKSWSEKSYNDLAPKDREFIKDMKYKYKELLKWLKDY